MSEYLQPGELELTPEQWAYWWEQLEFGENKVNYARKQLGLEPMERVTNGDLAVERMNNEVAAEEHEKHQQWRKLVIGQHATEMAYDKE